MLKFPYARRNFAELITENYLYLDRTHYIPTLEDWGKELVLMRPRRFGKSLWLSTLMNYYDIAKADDFEQLFGHLSIGQSPTSLRNQFMVMRWDFSQIPSHGSIKEIEAALNDYINGSVQLFQQYYGSHLRFPVEIHVENALLSLNLLVGSVRQSGYKLYLFIDEYDNFANEIMMASKVRLEGRTPFGPVSLAESQERYETLVKGEGLFKTIFKNLKAVGSGAGLDRVFMTGVSSIVLNDVTSGANVFEDISWERDFNALCGFTHQEIQQLVEQLVDGCGLPSSYISPTVDLMENYYNGSRFVDRYSHSIKGTRYDIPKVYNPTLTFHFLKQYQRECDYPQEMIDQNLATDESKLAYIGAFNEGKSLLEKALLGQEPISVETLRRRFGAKDLFNPNLQHDALGVLLCYLGGLTSIGERPPVNVDLAIPNLVMRKLYAERILAQIVKEDNAIIQAGHRVTNLLFTDGTIESLCTFVEEHLLPVFDPRDSRYFNELTVKTLFMTLLHNNQFYLMDSEPEMEQRYGDLLMLVRPGMTGKGLFDILIEFKYVPLDKITQKKNGKPRKVDGQAVKDAVWDELRAVDSVEAAFTEAKKQLRTYRSSLLKKYNEQLKLRTVAVVGIGMKRILWENVD